MITLLALLPGVLLMFRPASIVKLEISLNLNNLKLSTLLRFFKRIVVFGVNNKPSPATNSGLALIAPVASTSGISSAKNAGSCAMLYVEARQRGSEA